MIRIVAVTGRPSPAKDEVVDYLKEEHGIPTLEVGEIAQELAEQADELPRGRLVEKKRAAQHGPSHLVRRLLQEIEKGELEKVVITGLETPADVKTLKERFGPDFILAHVPAEEDTSKQNKMAELADVVLNPEETIPKQTEESIVSPLIRNT